MVPSLRMLSVSAAVVALGSPLAARAQQAPPSERVQYVRVIAKDYAFDSPTSLRAGITTFHLVNQGSDVHQLSIVEIGAGHSIKEFYDAMRVNGTPPGWAVTVGMTPTIQPNSEAFVALRLVPGHYVLACLLPAKDGRSHVEKGMYEWVNVVPVRTNADARGIRKP